MRAIASSLSLPLFFWVVVCIAFLVITHTHAHIYTHTYTCAYEGSLISSVSLLPLYFPLSFSLSSSA